MEETGHYHWVHAFLWTPAMVLVSMPQGVTATLNADARRWLLTILAAMAVAPVSALAR